MTLLKDIQFVCLDCEFTGLDIQEDRVIEVAAARFTLAEISDQYESLINPERAIPQESTAIHGITDSMVLNQPKMVEILPPLLKFIGDAIVIGHGIGFDLEMIEMETKKAHVRYLSSKPKLMDTLRLARLYGDSPTNSLSALAIHFNVSNQGAHRAMNDVVMNIAVFRHLVDRFKTLEQIEKILSRPIQMKYMPLGKHKGRLFSEIPLQYLQWAAGMEFDQDLLYSIRAELKKRKKGDSFYHANNPFSGL